MVIPNDDASDLLPDLEDLVNAARKVPHEASHQTGPVQTVAFFDLCGSTAAKLEIGVERASQGALTFTALAGSITARCGGELVKSLGDGVLAVFDDPLSACRAAVNLRYATHEFLSEEMTAGITAGRPIKILLDGSQMDLLGDVVDRAARIQSLAVPGQVLLDEALSTLVRGFVAGQSGWNLDEKPRMTHLKGIGTIALYELCLARHWQSKKELATPFNFSATGRPSLSEKLSLIRNAKREILEIGIGLTSFAQYFTGQKPEEFQEPIRQLVRSGVTLRCFALDPAYEPGVAWLTEQGNPDYGSEAAIARKRILNEARLYRESSYRGRLVYHTYQRVPEFWCLGVDVDDPVDGRMFFASYLMGVPRSSMPVVQVSRISNPVLFEKYMISIQALREASDAPKVG
jgi:class 3 adenylate cyclase